MPWHQRQDLRDRGGRQQILPYKKPESAMYEFGF